MLAVVGIVLLLIFYKMSYINTGLLTVIPGDLAQYIIFIGALIALVLLLLFELILLVISIKQTKKGEISGFVKAARFVLPIVFVVSFTIVCLCAFGMTSAKNVLDKEPSVVSQIKGYALKDSDEKGYAYSLLIENGDKLFYSKFSAEDVNDFEYSKEQFVSDSLSVFNDWDKF